MYIFNLVGNFQILYFYYYYDQFPTEGRIGLFEITVPVTLVPQAREGKTEPLVAVGVWSGGLLHCWHMKKQRWKWKQGSTVCHLQGLPLVAPSAARLHVPEVPQCPQTAPAGMLGPRTCDGLSHATTWLSMVVNHKLLVAGNISSMSPWLIRFLICAILMDLGLYSIWFACLALWVWAHPLFSKAFRVPAAVNCPCTPFARYPNVTPSLWYSLVPGLSINDIRIMWINITGAIFVSLMDHNSLPASDLCFHRTVPHSHAYQLPFDDTDFVCGIKNLVLPQCLTLSCAFL